MYCSYLMLLVYILGEFDYIAVEMRVSQNVAESRCETLDGHLCSVSSEDELAEVTSSMSNLTSPYWTGLTYNTDSRTLEFSDGTSTTFVRRQFSFNETSGKLCVVIRKTPRKLEQRDCSHQEYYICKVSKESRIISAGMNGWSTSIKIFIIQHFMWSFLVCWAVFA